ncbi:MAG: MBL fold metallo-hydrolase [Proteobacteria bacterium]|nr:MAG: MBL fold metallo-hydrolase [Pseudomonadota bacterium]
MNSNDIVNYPYGISVVDSQYYRPQFAASHLIVENGRAAFVDTGTTRSRPYLLKALSTCGLLPEDVDYIILTHIHLDHAGGAGAMIEACPRARLIVHPKGVRHMAEPEKLVAGTRAVYGAALFKKLYQTVIPVPEKRIIAAEDNFILDFNGRPLHFLDTPGHARHHCCIWDPTSKGVFTGDTMGLAYPALQTVPDKPFLVATTTPVAFEPDELKKSILRLCQRDPDYFYLTHYGPITANSEAVSRLVDMVDKFAELGMTISDLDELESSLLHLINRFWEAYNGRDMNKTELTSILAEDIKLNAQGLRVWAERIKRKKTA